MLWSHEHAAEAERQGSIRTGHDLPQRPAGGTGCPNEDGERCSKGGTYGSLCYSREEPEAINQGFEMLRGHLFLHFLNIPPLSLQWYRNQHP